MVTVSKTLQTSERKALESYNQRHKAASNDGRRFRLLSEVIAPYRSVSECITGSGKVANLEIRKIVITDSLRNRQIVVHSFDETIISVEFGSFEDKMAVPGRELTIISDHTSPKWDDEEVYSPEYNTLEQELAAILDGSYTVNKDKGILKLKTRDFTLDVAFGDSELASLLPIEPFGRDDKTRVTTKNRTLSQKVAEFEVDDGVLLKTVAIIGSMAAVIALILGR